MLQPYYDEIRLCCSHDKFAILGLNNPPHSGRSMRCSYHYSRITFPFLPLSHLTSDPKTLKENNNVHDPWSLTRWDNPIIPNPIQWPKPSVELELCKCPQKRPHAHTPYVVPYIYTSIKVEAIESPIFLKQRAPIVQVVLFGVYIVLLCCKRGARAYIAQQKVWWVRVMWECASLYECGRQMDEEVDGW